MLRLNAHSVEISITGCVEKIVHDPNLIPFSFSYYDILNFVSSRGRRPKP